MVRSGFEVNGFCLESQCRHLATFYTWTSKPSPGNGVARVFVLRVQGQVGGWSDGEGEVLKSEHKTEISGI